MLNPAQIISLFELRKLPDFGTVTISQRVFSFGDKTTIHVFTDRNSHETVTQEVGLIISGLDFSAGAVLQRSDGNSFQYFEATQDDVEVLIYMDMKKAPIEIETNTQDDSTTLEVAAQ